MDSVSIETPEENDMVVQVLERGKAIVPYDRSGYIITSIKNATQFLKKFCS